jgi:hypothetical protein
MNTYFEIYFNEKAISKICNTMSDTICFIENSINQDNRIPFKVVEKDKKTDRTVVIYKAAFSAKLEWTSIPKYQGKTLV